MFAIQFHYLSTQQYPKCNIMNIISVNHSMSKLMARQADLMGREHSYKSILALRTLFRCFYAWRKCQMDEANASWLRSKKDKALMSKYFNYLYYDAHLFRSIIQKLRTDPALRTNGLIFLSYFSRYHVGPEFDTRLKRLVREVQDPVDQRKLFIDKLSVQ